MAWFSGQYCMLTLLTPYCCFAYNVVWCLTTWAECIMIDNQSKFRGIFVFWEIIFYLYSLSQVVCVCMCAHTRHLLMHMWLMIIFKRLLRHTRFTYSYTAFYRIFILIFVICNWYLYHSHKMFILLFVGIFGTQEVYSFFH